MNRPHRLSRKYGTEGPCYRARPGLPLVFVDLGKRKVGWAVFIDGELAHCGTTSLKRGVAFGPDVMALLVVETVMRATGIRNARKLDWVCEWPHVRQGFRVAKEDVEALQAVGKALGRKVGGWKEKYRPHEWKGTIPKRVHRRRGRELLSEEEGLLLPPDSEHDTWDGILGGLFALGRCGVGGLL